MPRPKKIKQETSEVTQQSNWNFFTEADVSHRGDICSQVPSWSMTQLIDELDSDISALEKNSKDYSIAADKRAKILADLAERKERRDMIENKPKLDKDRIKKLVGSDRVKGTLGEKISDSMFSVDDMNRGIADAAVEMRRMLDPCIKLEPEECEIAQGCNVRITKDRMVSRDDAIKVWRIGRLYNDDMSNPELLRK
jgi:hypothetical protein